MVAVDTNVLVRLLTEDDPKQVARARSLFQSEPIWIAKTVLLETCWVLRSLYGFDETIIGDAFRKLLGLSNVSMEDRQSVIKALTLATDGIEIVDAIHLSSRPPSTVFASFDRYLIRRAKRAGAGDLSSLSE